MSQLRIDSRSFSNMGIPDHSVFAFGGNLPPFARKEIARKIGITYEKKGGLGAIVGLAASIAIPFAAPAIASSIGLSASIGSALGSTVIGNTIGAAIVGAGLGAASSLVTGQKMGQAALMGFVGGGIGGYARTPTATTTGAAGANVGTAPAGVDMTRVGVANLGDTAAVATQDASGTWFTQAGQAVDPSQIAYGGNLPTSALSDTLSAQDAASMLSNSGQLQTNLPSALGGSADTFAGGAYGSQFYNPDVTGLAPSGAAPGVSYATQTAPAYQQAGLAVTPQAQAAAQTASQAPTATAKQPTSAWEAIKSRVADPMTQADLMLRAAGQLAGSQMAGTGLSADQQALVDAQKAELADLQKTNRALFEQRLNEATNLIGESRYFDPAYFGMQAQRGVTTGIQRQKEEALRGLAATDPRRAGLRSAEARRYNLEAASRGQSAYLQGADSAQNQKIKLAAAGLSVLPTAAPSTYTGAEANSYQELLKTAEEQRKLAIEGTGKLFGSLTGSTASQSMG